MRSVTRSRGLCPEEIAAARKVFGATIDYSRVRVVNGKYTFAHLKGYVICPNGRIYWPDECGNLVLGDDGRHLRRFIHEMTHVLQHQRGVPVLMKGLLLHSWRLLTLGLYNPYRYRYRPGRPFSSYNIEQQADIAVGIFEERYENTIDLPGGSK